jgi:hypothetical protein
LNTIAAEKEDIVMQSLLTGEHQFSLIVELNKGFELHLSFKNYRVIQKPINISSK